jgi:signal transduction histidine kinase
MTDPERSSDLTARVRALVAQPWSRRRPWLYVAIDGGLLVYVALLVATGYPPWRIAAVAAVGAAWIVVHALDVVALRRAGGQSDARRIQRVEWAMLATGFVAVGLAGGLRSPLLPGAVAGLPLAVFQRGWTGQTKAQWLVTGLGALAVALLPAWVTGPPSSAGLYGVLVTGSVGVVLGATVLYLGLLTRVAHDSLREAREAREAMTLQAMARARDLEQLGAQLSHELRNPLSAIKTLVQLSARSATDEASRERLEVVEGEIRRMQQVLQDYLSFSRPLERIQPEEVRLAAVADEVLALLAGRADEHQVALRRLGDASVTADPLRLKEALLNLMVNALQASPAGGRVEVEIAQEGGTARLSVRDAGHGMAPEVLERVGTPFFTTREGGTGLGVALARATLVRHGGTLEFESRPGEGTTATLTLPATAGRRDDVARAGGG